MNIREAYAKVKELPGRNVLVECRNCIGYWGFLFSSDSTRQPGKDIILGGPIDFVNKRTGKITQMSIPHDILKIPRGIEVKVEYFTKDK